MAATVTPLTPRRSRASAQLLQPHARRPFRDSPRRILAGIAVLVVALVGLLILADRTPSVSPDFLTEFVLYALTAADLTMLAALSFVLARNIVKLVVERRRGLPFARFRAKLVAVLLGMTLVPALAVLVVGSELIRTNIDRWFNAPMDEILTAANQIASDYYRERQTLVSDDATRTARALSDVDLAHADAARIRSILAPAATARRVQTVHVYRIVVGGLSRLEPIVEEVAPVLPPGYSRAAADRLAAQVLGSSADSQSVEALGTAGELLHAGALIRTPAGRVTGVVVATDYLSGEVAARAHRMTQAFEGYSQLRVLRRPLTGVYLSFFVMVTLLILFGATWMGSYLAKRITRPVQTLAAAAREIGAGHLEQHIEPETGDEFGALTEAFNAMASELVASRRKVERSRIDLEEKHLDVEGRRRYVETILERIATGVVSVDAGGGITMVNGAALRLLGLDRDIVGQAASAVFERADLQPLAALFPGGGEVKAGAAAQELVLPRDGHELHLTAVATPLIGESGAREGVVLVLDDVTPLIRTQKIAAWREVARRLAHEIKNPLTPIQLSAERLRRHFATAPASARALIEECTQTIVGEVESLKGLVDEFSQFARMPSPRAVPTNLHQLLIDSLALYNGIFADVTIERRFGADVPLVRLDPLQIRRVIINLMDNAVEAMERRGSIVVETQRDASNSIVKLVVADDGPGIPTAERDKLFLPYYSTKRRGSGLGLAIVRRIIAEHGGSIEVGDNHPRGTRFTIELPC